MKNIYLTSLITLFFGISHAQLVIGKNEVSSSAVSLEFGEEDKGLLLPWINSISDLINPTNGTLIFDYSDNKIKVKYASGWKDLSVNINGTTVNPNTNVDGLEIQNNLYEEVNAKVSIGNPTDVQGILVLEDSDKAMVLPKVVNPHENIINPSPGMMVYNPHSERFAVFNGTVWTYWKAQD